MNNIKTGYICSHRRKEEKRKKDSDIGTQKKKDIISLGSDNAGQSIVVVVGNGGHALLLLRLSLFCLQLLSSVRDTDLASEKFHPALASCWVSGH